MSHSRIGVCKGEAEGVHTGGVHTFSSSGLLITTFRGCSPVWHLWRQSATQVKITKKEKTPTGGYVIHPLLFAFRGCFLAFTI